MGTLTGLERILRALKLQEPDMVPHAEMLIYEKVRNAILPTASYEDFIDKMDIDGIVIYDKLYAWRFTTIDDEKGIQKDQWGGTIRFMGSDLGVSLDTAIKSEKDLERYIPPDPDESWRYDKLKAVVKRFKGQRAVIVSINDVFNTVQESVLGHFDYFDAMVNNPDFVDRVNDIVLNYNLKYIKNCVEVGADVIFISGDYAMTNGPMVSPKHTARYLTPNLKKMVDLAHSFNRPLIKHSDGNIWKIFDLIIDTGIDCIHPIDVVAGMEIGEVKEKYGKKVCLMGNVNAATTLCSGTLEEVRQDVKNCIRKGGPHGGYICSSSNAIHSGVKPENYAAMIKAIREFGKYPLQLD